MFAHLDDALVYLFLRQASALREQLAPTVGTIGCHRHRVGVIHLEGLSVLHRDDVHLLSLRLRHIHLVDDACR